MNNNIIKQYLHFDSIAAKYIYDTNNTSGNTSNCYKATFPLTTTFRKIKRVWLKSVEITTGFPNIRTGSTNILKFILNGTTYNVTLTESNYTTITSVLSVLSVACNTAILGSGITMTFNLNSTNINRLQINFSSATSFSIIDTNLSKYILGFRTTDTLATNIFTASSSNYNLNVDNYINLYMPSFNAYNANQNGSWSTFKLPLNSINNQIYFYQDESSFEQSIDINDNNLVLSSLVVYVLDRFGNNLNPNGLDYSFTLAINYEL